MALTVGELAVKLHLSSIDFSQELARIKAELLAVAKTNVVLKAVLSFDKKGLLEAQSATDTLGSGLRSLQAEASRTGQSFFNLGNIIKGSLSYFVGTALVNGMRAISSGIMSIIPTAANFQEQMGAVKAVTDLTGIAFQDLQQKALQLGASTKYSASQTASAIEMLAKNGLTGAQILNGGIDAALAFAAATGTDLSQAADVASTAVLQFNLSAEQMPSAVNAMTGSINASRMGINDLRLAMANGGGIANQYGVSLQDFNTTMAAVINQFSGGSDAGTAFKTFLLSLTPSTQPAIETFRQLGLITADGTNKFFTATGELKSMEEVFSVLRTAMQGLTPAMQQAYGKIMFGTDSVRMMNGILQTSASEWETLSAAIRDTDAVDQAAIRMDNLNGISEGISGSLETLAITLGSTALPGLQELGTAIIGIINTATTLVQAVGGSQEAFLQLSPALQVAIVMVQDILGYFASLADAAASWGQNIGGSFASGIIDAASAVIDALMEMGSWIEYWLAPGSPPRVAPDLDVWGKEVAEVYFNAFGDADSGIIQKKLEHVLDKAFNFSLESLSGLKQLTSQAQNILHSIFDSTTTSDKITVLEKTLGTKEAIKQALQEFEKTGTVTEATFQKITRAAGSAGTYVARYIQFYFDQRKAAEQLAKAQGVLYAAQKKLADLESAKDRESQPVRAALAEIQAKQELADLEGEIVAQSQIAQAVGGDGSAQKAAKLKLQELALKKQLLLIEQSHKAGIDQAATEIEAAQQAMSNAEEKKRQADQQLALEESKIQAMLDQNSLIKEQIELTRQLILEQEKQAEEQKKAQEEVSPKKSGGGGGGGKEDQTAERNAKAQERYNYELADTEGKLGLLRARLATVEEGSAEYYQVLGDIRELEQKQSNERAKLAEEEQKEKERAIKAQKDYEYSIAGTGEKLAILRQRLGEVKEGSAEYYEILKQIDSVQKQYDTEIERSAKETGASASKGGGSQPKAPLGGTGRRIPSTPSLPKEIGGATKPVTEFANDAKQKIQDVRDKVEAFTASVDTAKRKVAEFTSPITTLAGNLNSLLLPALAALATPMIVSALGGIGVALAGLLSPIALVSLAVGALVLAWQSNFMGVQRYTSQVLGIIQDIFVSYTTLFATIWSENGEQITQTFMTAWEYIKTILGTLLLGIVSILESIQTFIEDHSAQIQAIIVGVWQIISGTVVGVLGVMAGIISAILAVIQGNWSGVWEGIRLAFSALWNGIVTFLTGILSIIAALFGTSLDAWQTQFTTWLGDIRSRWTAFWGVVYDTASKLISIIVSWVTDRLMELGRNWTTFISGVQTTWGMFWGSILEKASSVLDSVFSAVVSGLLNVKAQFDTISGAISSAWKTKLAELPMEAQTELNNIKAKLSGMVSELSAAAKGIGTGIVEGIKKGISDGISGIADAAKRAAQAAVAAAKEALDINSPSRVFMAIGKRTNEGLALGITDSIGKVTDAMDYALGHVVRATDMSGKLGEVQTRIGEAVQTQSLGMPSLAYATIPTPSAFPQVPSYVNNFSFTIDARGATMTEDEYRHIVRTEITKQVTEGIHRRRI
jgi:TP901 family phage tail tape measure protein